MVKKAMSLQYNRVGKNDQEPFEYSETALIVKISSDEQKLSWWPETVLMIRNYVNDQEFS